MIRVVLPAHLRALARFEGELHLELDEPVTIERVVAAIEERFPMLRGTIRDGATGRRRPYVRYFACERDLSHDATDAELPTRIARGEEPLLIVGAMSGG
ncbi:MAG: MoaD/ThiS family protein [bacterium]|nr:MoaD/ThiS family protein [bacterium]